MMRLLCWLALLLLDVGIAVLLGGKSGGVRPRWTKEREASRSSLAREDGS